MYLKNAQLLNMKLSKQEEKNILDLVEEKSPYASLINQKFAKEWSKKYHFAELLRRLDKAKASLKNVPPNDKDALTYVATLQESIRLNKLNV